MEIKYLEWNLHAMGERGYEIPKFVVSYLRTVDVFVLTELCQKKGWEDFRSTLESEYDIYCSPYSSKGYNQVCIGLRKSLKYKLISIITQDICNVDIPEFLQVNILIGEIKLNIIGVRVKTENSNKDKQYEFLKSYLQTIDAPFLCLGDFNCTCGTLATKLNCDNSMELRGKTNSFCVFGPRITNGYFSFVFEENKNYDNNKQGLDWVIASEKITVENNYPDKKQSPKATYDWSFVTDHNGYVGKTKDDHLNIKGLPDHAILKGMFKIDKE
ncbi:MAG: endonuclease/exonuclease/phosphatase family protein [Butyrivibrio sp.]